MSTPQRKRKLRRYQLERAFQNKDQEIVRNAEMDVHGLCGQWR